MNHRHYYTSMSAPFLRILLVACLVISSTRVEAQQADLSRLSLRLSDWVANNTQTLNRIRVGIRLESEFEIRAFDKQLYRENVSLEDRSRLVIQKLQAEANEKQPGVINWLRLLPGIDLSQMETFWVDNLIFFEASANAVVQMSLNPEIEYIDMTSQLSLDEPVESSPSLNRGKTAVVGGHEPGHDAIGAPWMWSMGYTGRGRIAMGVDTGVDPRHPALGYKWQGNFRPASQGWYDGSGSYPTPESCSSTSHGTHTMGTVLGLDPITNDTIGVAPDGRWIASPGICTASSTTDLINSFQWSMNPDGDINTTIDMPDVICNSWFDNNTTNECTGLYKQTFDAVEAVGIAIVFSAGNDGPAPGTISQPKNINNDTTSVFCVGSTFKTSPYNISSFSSRGPSNCPATGGLLIKPEVVAPGGAIRSAVGSSTYGNKSGTSMAAPHVCGAILLLKEAFPNLTGRQMKMALYLTATDLGAAGEDNIYGNGLINLPNTYNYLIAQGNTPATYAVDAAAIGINVPTATYCDNDVAPEIVIQNDGLSPLTSLTVEYRFAPGNFSTYNWSGNLAVGSNTVIILPNTNLQNGSHQMEINLINPNGVTDDRPYNNFLYLPFDITEATNIVGDTLLACPGTANLNVTNTPVGGNVYWYTSLTNPTPFATGPTVSQNVGVTTTYFAERVNQGKVGPVDNTIGAGGFFGNDSRWIIFDAFLDFRIKSVFVYADGAGNRTIEIRNNTGAIVETATLNLVDGPQRITLDFDIPTGNDYEFAIDGNNDLYRNLNGTNYPYSLPGVVSITGPNSGDDYYYFYDWEVEYGAGCGRTPVTVQVAGQGSVAGITQSTTQVDLAISGTVNFMDNSTPIASSWFWDFGDSNTSMLQNPTHTYTQVGTYNVMFIADPGSNCSDTSYTTVEVVNNPVGLDIAAGQSLEIYPNPTQAEVRIRLIQGVDVPVKFSLYNVLGVKVAEVKVGAASEMVVPMDLSELSSGTYFLKVQSDAVQVVRRVVKR